MQTPRVYTIYQALAKHGAGTLSRLYLVKFIDRLKTPVIAILYAAADVKAHGLIHAVICRLSAVSGRLGYALRIECNPAVWRRYG